MPRKHVVTCFCSRFHSDSKAAYRPCKKLLQTAWRSLANMLEIYDYLLQNGAHVDIAKATRHTAYYVTICRHPQNR